MKGWFAGWEEPGSRGSWLVVLAVFGALELVLRLKIGSVFMLIAAWVLVQHWLWARLEPDRSADYSRRLVDALTMGTGAAAIIMACLLALNAVARSLDNGFRFFQLP